MSSISVRHVGVCAGADRCCVRCWAGRVFAAPQMSNRGDKGGKASSFNVLSAVSGARLVAEASRSVVQKQGDAIRNAEAKRLREQGGTSSAAAFGSASSFAAAQRLGGGGLAAAPVPRAGDISPRPVDCAEEEGGGEGSANNSPRGRSRSPSFKPFSATWRKTLFSNMAPRACWRLRGRARGAPRANGLAYIWATSARRGCPSRTAGGLAVRGAPVVPEPQLQHTWLKFLASQIE